jgi:hypothetical protein
VAQQPVVGVLQRRLGGLGPQLQEHERDDDQQELDDHEQDDAHDLVRVEDLLVIRMCSPVR